MSRHLYSPRLSDDLVRALYREGQHRRIPMTRLLDDLVRSALSAPEISSCMVRETTAELCVHPKPLPSNQNNQP